MKKIGFMFFTLLYSTLSIFGIDYSVGGRINFTINTLTADSSIFADKGFILGGGISAIGYIEFTENFAVQPEFTFSCQNGMNYSLNNERQRLSFSTIDIPILIKGQLPIGPGFLGVNLGPQFSFIISNIMSKDEKTTTYQTVREKKFNVFLFGFITGVNYNIPLSYGIISFDIRFMMDFTHVAQPEKNLGNRIRFSPSIGYLFKFNCQ